jgi:hypothetical protein
MQSKYLLLENFLAVRPVGGGSVYLNNRVAAAKWMSAMFMNAISFHIATHALKLPGCLILPKIFEARW